MIPFWNPWDHRNAQDRFSRIFIRHQDYQDSQECLKTGNLVTFRHLNGTSRFYIHLQDDQYGQECPKKHIPLCNSSDYGNAQFVPFNIVAIHNPNSVQT